MLLTDLPGIATILGNIGTSDHNPVVTQLEISASYDKPYKRKLWCYVKANFWDMRGHFSSILWSALFKDNDNDPKKVCTKFTEVICDTMDAYISQANWSPTKQGTKKRLAPLKTRKICTGRKTFRQAERNAKSNASMKLKNVLADRSRAVKRGGVS